jgi:hypothetical protein
VLVPALKIFSDESNSSAHDLVAVVLVVRRADSAEWVVVVHPSEDSVAVELVEHPAAVDAQAVVVDRS